MSNNNQSRLLNRRTFLKGLSVALGSTVAANVMAGDKLAMALAYHGSASDKAANLFSPAQRKTLFAVCDAILPKTDTPSATQVDCHGFVEHQLVHCYQEG